MNPKNEINTVVDVVSVAEENPCISNLPPVPDTKTAAEVFHLGALPLNKSSRQATAHRERRSRKGDESLIPLPVHIRLLVQATALARRGYDHRNLMCEAYRAENWAAQAVAAQGTDRHGQIWLRPEMNLPRARPRGLLLVAPARMGRRVTAERIASFLGEKPIHLRVPTPTGDVVYTQIPVLRVLWPVDGNVATFIGNFLAAFDRAMGSRYSAVLRPARFRLHDEAVSILSGFCIGANIGLMIVERINTWGSDTPTATILWNVLGQLTRTTGIPLLSMASTGAASNLMRNSSAAHELTVAGTLRLDAPSANSQEWADVCTLAFQQAMKRSGPAPAWLVQALALHTGCRLALASRVCIELARSAGKADLSVPPPHFDALVDKALYVDKPALKALSLLADPRGYSRISLSRVSDWLPTQHAHRLIPDPEPEASPRRGLIGR